MSRTIDEKVVEMRFDNKQFESNVKTSMSTLDKLKEKLNFKGASKGLESISEAAKNVNLSGIGKAVDIVGSRFSALEIMGITTLANLSNQAVNTAKTITAAFTIDPVKSGFQEYETQINAVQTILANTESKGSTLKDVNEALAELNTYADKTIYNFTEMTRNIGTFTAAGVDLNTSVQAIKGIANLAAVSGSTSMQASTAMYQLSQALAAGTVKLQDWNSVVNAGMGGQVFQDALKETARAHGIAIDQMIADQGSFRETLQKGWLTAEVLTDTLNKFTGDMTAADLAAKGYTEDQVATILKMGQTANDAATKVKTFTQLMDTLKEAAQSGWTQTWQLIFGDFEEAKKLFTEISDTFGEFINKSSNARNSFLGGALAPLSELQNEIANAGIETEIFQQKLLEVAKEHGLITDEMIAKEGAFNDIMASGKISGSIIAETLRKITGIADDTSNAFGETADNMEKFGDVVNNVIRGDFGNGQARIEALTKAGYDYATIQGLVNVKLLGTAENVENLSDAQLKNMGYTEDQIKSLRKLIKECEDSDTPISQLIEKLNKPSGRDLLIDSARNAFKGLIRVLRIAKKEYREVFPKMTSDQLYHIIEKIHEFSEGLKVNKEEAQQWHDTFRGLFNLLHLFTTLTGGALKLSLRALSAVLGKADISVLDITSSIGKAITKFHDFLLENDKLTQGLVKMAKFLWAGVVSIHDWIAEFSSLPKVQAHISDFKDGFVEALAAIKNHTIDGKALLKTLVDSIKSMDHITLKGLAQTLKDFYHNDLKNFGENFDGCFDKIKQSISGFGSDLKDSFKKFGIDFDAIEDRISKFASFVKDHLEHIDVGAILTMGIGAGLIAAAMKIGKALETISGPIDGITGVIESFSKTIDAKTLELKSEAMINMAKAIAIMAGSLVAISMIPADKLADSTTTLTILAGTLIVLGVAMATLNKVDKIGVPKLAGTLLALAASIGILAMSLKLMSVLDSKNLGRNVAILTGLLVTLAIVAGALGNYAPTLSKGSLTLITLAGAIKILVDAFIKLDSIDYEHFSQNVKVMKLAMIGLVAMTIAASRLGRFNKGAGLQVLACAVSLKILVSAFNDIANLDLDKMKNNIGAFITIFGMLAILMISSNLAGKYAIKAGVGILAMSASLILISLGMRSLAGMDAHDIKKSVGIVSELMLVMGAVIALSNFAGKNAIKAGVMLLMMAGAIGVLTVVIFALSKIDDAGLTRATTTLTVIMGMFGFIIGMTKLAQDCKSTLIMIAVTLGILAISIGALAMIDAKQLVNATKCLSMIMGMFAVLIGVSQLAKGATKSLVVMGIVVAAFGGVLFGLCQLPMENARNVAESLSILILSISASMLLISLVPVKAALAGIAGFAIVVAGLTGILAAFGGLSKIDGFNDLISDGGKSLALVGKGIGDFFGGILNGLLGGMASGIVDVADSLAAFIDHLQPFVSGVKTIDGDVVAGVLKLSEAILILSAANFVSGITTLFGGSKTFASAADGLPMFGTAIAEFSKNVAGKVKPEAVKMAAEAGIEIAKMAKELPNQGGLLGDLVGNNDMGLIGPQLKAFAEALVSFSNVVSKENAIDLKAVKLAAKAGKYLAGMADELPNQGGLLGVLVGNNDMSLIAPQLEAFAKAIVIFSAVVSTGDPIDLKAIETAITASTMIVDMAKDLPNCGGVVAAFVGDNTMDTFGKDLESFGNSLVAFSNSIKDLSLGSISRINTVRTIATTLVEMANDIPTTGGLKSLFVGNSGLGSFGNKLESFGASFARFSESIKGVSTTATSKMETIATVTKSLVEMANDIPTTGGLKSLFEGNSGIGSFGNKLESFGASFAAFSKSVKDIKIDTVTATANVTVSMATLAESISKNKAIFDEGMNLAAFGVLLSSFGYDFSTFYGRIKSVDTSLIDGIARNLNSFISIFDRIAYGDFSKVDAFTTALNKLGTEGIDQFIESFGNADDKLELAATNITDAFVKGIQNNKSDFEAAYDAIVDNGITRIKTKEFKFTSAGITLMTKFAEGITTKSTVPTTAIAKIMEQAFLKIKAYEASFKARGQALINNLVTGIEYRSYTVSNAFTTAISEGLRGIRESYQSFYQTGSFVASGFADGISANSFKAEAMAREMARKSAEAARIELAVNSPSKVFYAIGNYSGLGFVKALSEYASKAYGAGSEMARAAKDGLSNTLTQVASIVDMGLDTQPTIRPVLDLSDVRAGASSLNGMLNLQRTIGLSANAGVVNVTSRNSQNGSDEVVSAINNLRRTLSRSNGDVYNVNGITYDDGSNVASAVKSLVRAARMERRV